MVVVLADSRNVGKTSWIACRGLCSVEVSGVVGDVLQLCTIASLNDPELQQVVEADGMYELPEGTEFVRAEHIKTGNGRVFIDLR